MSTTTSSSASPTVVRSQSTSSRAHSHRPAASDFPPRTRSVAVRPSSSQSPQHHHNHHPHHSHSKSNSYDRRPPTNNAVFDNIARRDFDARDTQPTSSRRDSSNHRVQESSTYRSDSTKKHRRNHSSQSSHRNSVPMAAAAAAPAMADGASGPPHQHSATPAQPKRRTTITTPSGHWALGKTIGAGSMGKVKLAKNVETGEQVRSQFLSCFSYVTLAEAILIAFPGGRQDRAEAICRGASRHTGDREVRPLKRDSNGTRSCYRQPGEPPVYLRHERCGADHVPLVHAV